LSLESDFPMARIEVVNLLGQPVIVAPVRYSRAETLGLAGLPSGLYVVRVTLEDGQTIALRHVIRH
jgi:Asp-tRNA(Asn)/Glu-tRNA(Gln) amidotransferase A subunit family amidase